MAAAAKGIVREHVQVHRIVEYEHFPEHDQRAETLEFRNAKHELESIEHLGCYVCKTKVQRESHHIFERSEWNGLDVRSVAFFLFHHFDFHGHVRRDFRSHADLCEWFMQHFGGRIEHVEVDGLMYEVHVCDDNAADTIYNQWILCQDHHRGMSIGIHGCTTPTFFAWLARRPDFKPSLTEAEYEKGVSA